MNNLDMANALLGSKRVNPGQTTTAYGVATSPSVNGLVMVDMGGDTVSPDDDQSIECETTFKVFEGDEVIVSLVGADGTGKTPTVMGVVGRGDQMQSEIDSVKNYFWVNDRGAHVSTREESVAGNNILIDADSLDVRYGETNSEEDQTLLARFGRNTAYIGGVDGTPYWTIKDLRDKDTGNAIVEDIKYGDGIKFTFVTDFKLTEVLSVKADGVELEEGEDYTVDSTNSSIIFDAAVGGSVQLIFTYTTSEGVFSYSDGIRRGSYEGAYSKTTGLINVASGSYSQANGYNTEATGWGSVSDGYMTVANSRLQKVFGLGNVPDGANKYIEIIGNGSSSVLYATKTIVTDGETSEFEMSNSPNQIVSANSYGNDNSYFNGIAITAARTQGDKNHLYVTFSWDNPLPTRIAADFNFTISYTAGKDPISATTYSTTGRYKLYIDSGNTNIAITHQVENNTGYDIWGGSFIRILSYSANVGNKKDFVKDVSIHLNKIVLPSYISSLVDETVIIMYRYGEFVRSNAYNLDWSGNAEYKGAIFMSGCTPNGDTPYSATRFNHTDYKLQYYYNGSVNKRWVTLQEYYNSGFYIGQDVGIMAMGNGMITDSGKQIQLQFVLPNPVFDPSMIEEAVILIMVGGMRGIKGYINSSAYNTDWGALLKGSGYSYDLKIVGTNTMSLIINKTSVFSNYTNNTPVNFNALELSIGFNRYVNPPIGS